jgi:hypothetical protein
MTAGRVFHPLLDAAAGDARTVDGIRFDQMLRAIHSSVSRLILHDVETD